ncbi:hypothetical protein BS47DRAFT_1339936 [Hydnum rufescens UP504]|uniref:Uncharacterized protein n=1 Tax=Hydnum rufescens UP504 TaxID=1448309 RepID=A0A9P6B3U5_9AGAM|nr:hypothetical protein BS47DRAFT_1339936 [Hydnum rufescens UP504]
MPIGDSQEYASINHDLPNEASSFAFPTTKSVGTRSMTSGGLLFPSVSFHVEGITHFLGEGVAIPQVVDGCWSSVVST